MEYKYDVFISYSRKDYVDANQNIIPENAITEIQNIFDKNGISYWFDRDGIYSGQEFIEVITSAITESKMLVFISSKHSNESIWTAGEIFEALDGEKTIIPVKIDNSQYNKKFKLLIRPLDFINYEENPKNALNDLLRAINKVKEDVAQKLREEKELMLKREAEAKKEEIKKEINVLAKDCQRLMLQQLDIVKQISEKQIFIGNTTKLCPVCDKVVSITSEFCGRCGWVFPILYNIDENSTFSLNEKQISIARINWRSINIVSELQSTKNNLEIEVKQLKNSLLKITEERENVTQNLSQSELALQKATNEIGQMRIRNKELENYVQESIEKNEEIKKSLGDSKQRLQSLIVANNELHKNLSEKQEIVSKIKEKYNYLLEEQKINKYKSFRNRDDVFELVRGLCRSKVSSIKFYNSLLFAGLLTNSLTQTLAKDYGLEFTETTISSFTTIGNLVDAIWVKYSSILLSSNLKKEKINLEIMQLISSALYVGKEH